MPRKILLSEATNSKSYGGRYLENILFAGVPSSGWMCFSIAEVAAGFSSPPIVWEQDQIGYMLSGKIIFESKGKELEVSSGEIFHIRKGEEVTFFAQQRARYIFVKWN
jgi:ethanolamine utilization protein EutQ (cupin superfamily)